MGLIFCTPHVDHQVRHSWNVPCTPRTWDQNCVCKLYRPLVRYVAKFYINGSAGTLHLVQVICWKLLRNKLLSLVSIIVCCSQTPVMPLCILLSSTISQKKNGLCAKFTSKSCGIISFQY